MANTPPVLSSSFVHLGLGGTAVEQPHFDGMAWYEAYDARHGSGGKDGRLVSMHTFTSSWDMWECHPVGAELVVCAVGAMTIVQEIDGQVVRTRLEAGQYAINAPGVWHTADVDEGGSATVFFVTAGEAPRRAWRRRTSFVEGTTHRPR